MKMTSISIKQLFGTYDYDIRLNYKEYVTILHAPNGMGKTTVLRMIKAVIDGDILFLDETPFKMVKLDFEDGSFIEVSKEDVFKSFQDDTLKKVRSRIVRSKSDAYMPIEYKIKNKDGNAVTYKMHLSQVLAPYYSSRMSPRFREAYLSPDDAELTLRELYSGFRFEHGELIDNDELTDILEDYKKELEIHIIEANRLFTSSIVGGDRPGRERVSQMDSIRVYSNELKAIIDNKKKEKEEVSEELDRTFPNRILDLFLHSDDNKEYKKEDIRKALIDLENKRVELEKIGLVNENITAKFPDETRIPKETLSVLNLYIEDNTKKIEVYDDLKRKLETLLEIINERNGFSNKKMLISADEGVKFVLDNGREIPLEKLSSGEKNDFILFYELIFKCNENSLILIDEPEISLHIAWQQEFVNELLRICRINNMQAIVATHSPNIVDEHWDLLKDMMEEENGI